MRWRETMTCVPGEQVSLSVHIYGQATHNTDNSDVSNEWILTWVLSRSDILCFSIEILQQIENFQMKHIVIIYCNNTGIFTTKWFLKMQYLCQYFKCEFKWEIYRVLFKWKGCESSILCRWPGISVTNSFWNEWIASSLWTVFWKMWTKI